MADVCRMFCFSFCPGDYRGEEESLPRIIKTFLRLSDIIQVLHLNWNKTTKHVRSRVLFVGWRPLALWSVFLWFSKELSPFGCLIVGYFYYVGLQPEFPANNWKCADEALRLTNSFYLEMKVSLTKCTPKLDCILHYTDCPESVQVYFCFLWNQWGFCADFDGVRILLWISTILMSTGGPSFSLWCCAANTSQIKCLWLYLKAIPHLQRTLFCEVRWMFVHWPYWCCRALTALSRSLCMEASSTGRAQWQLWLF